MNGLHGNRYMDNTKRQALKNAARVARRLQSGEELNSAEVIKELRKPLPPLSVLESDQAIRADYDHYVLHAGVSQPYRVLSYDEAAALTGKSVEAVRQAAYRGSINKTTEFRKGRERVGVRLDSLRKWVGWNSSECREASRRLDAMRSS
jgi:hypothetical protein